MHLLRYLEEVEQHIYERPVPLIFLVNGHNAQETGNQENNYRCIKA